MIKKNLITRNGLDDLKKSLAKLEGQRPGAVERVETARQMGDLRENSEYHAAREDLTLLDTQINELKEVLANIQIVDKNSNASSVGLESLVTLKNDSNEEVVYRLVGEHESNPLNKKISYTSPLGQALMGKRTGDEVVFEAPRGKVNYKIIDIN